MNITKEFILEALLKYKNNPSLCGYNGERCMYLTKDGKKCAIGQFMKVGNHQKYENGVFFILTSKNLNKIFKKKYLPIFENSNNKQTLIYMQNYHDAIAQDENPNYTVENIETITGFNLNELKYEI